MDRRQALATLREAFPSWDDAALRDVLEASNNDPQAAAEALLQWSQDAAAQDAAGPQDAAGRVDRGKRRAGTFKRARQEPEAPSSIYLVLLCCLSRSGEAASGAELLVAPRPDYDKAMSRRLVRQISARRALRVLVHIKGVFHERAKLAKAHVAERRRLKRCDSRVACGGGEGEPEAPKLSREEEIERGKVLLGQRLTFLNLLGVEIEDDGNCQFRALSAELCGSQERHGDVRRIAVEHMRATPDEFSVFFDEAEWDRYLRTMAMPKTWGDELTLRAVCDALRVKIHVLTTADENWYLQYDPEGAPVRELFLTYVSPIHYNVMRPRR